MKRKMIIICFAILMGLTVLIPAIGTFIEHKAMPQGESGSYYLPYVLSEMFLLIFIPYLLLIEGEACHFLLYIVSEKVHKTKGRTILNVLALFAVCGILGIPLTLEAFTSLNIDLGVIIVFILAYILLKGVYCFRYCLSESNEFDQ